MVFVAIVVALAGVLAGVAGVAFGFVRRAQVEEAMYRLVHWCLKDPTILYRGSQKEWWEEVHTAPLPWRHQCANCDWWDGRLGGESSSRIHAAVDHVYNTKNGQRNGYDVADRNMSTTTSLAVVIWRTCGEDGWKLHRLRVNPENTVDLRWLHVDVPFLEAQCRACYLEDPDDQAAYSLKWGVELQEVLVDRCSLQSHHFETVPIVTGMFPQWAIDLAFDVNLLCYRRKDRTPGRFELIDLWALVSEWRLRMMLRGVF